MTFGVLSLELGLVAEELDRALPLLPALAQGMGLVVWVGCEQGSSAPTMIHACQRVAEACGLARLAHQVRLHYSPAHRRALGVWTVNPEAPARLFLPESGWVAPLCYLSCGHVTVTVALPWPPQPLLCTCDIGHAVLQTEAHVGRGWTLDVVTLTFHPFD